MSSYKEVYESYLKLDDFNKGLLLSKILRDFNESISSSQETIPLEDSIINKLRESICQTKYPLSSLKKFQPSPKPIVKSKRYHKQVKVVKLYRKYHSYTSTKQETYSIISKELKIKPNSVKRAILRYEEVTKRGDKKVTKILKKC